MTTDTRKLFIVSVNTQVIVLANNEADAREIVDDREALDYEFNDGSDIVVVHPLREFPDGRGPGSGAKVYSDGKPDGGYFDDINIDEALEIDPSPLEIKP